MEFRHEEKVAGTAEWRDYRACWWDHDVATMAFGPVLRVWWCRGEKAARIASLAKGAARPPAS